MSSAEVAKASALPGGAKKNDALSKMVRNRYFYIPAVSKYLVTLKFTRQEALL
jgi:hypothetical protein